MKPSSTTCTVYAIYREEKTDLQNRIIEVRVSWVRQVRRTRAVSRCSVAMHRCMGARWVEKLRIRMSSKRRGMLILRGMIVDCGRWKQLSESVDVFLKRSRLFFMGKEASKAKEKSNQTRIQCQILRVGTGAQLSIRKCANHRVYM